MNCSQALHVVARDLLAYALVCLLNLAFVADLIDDREQIVPTLSGRGDIQTDGERWHIIQGLARLLGVTEVLDIHCDAFKFRSVAGANHLSG